MTTDPYFKYSPYIPAREESKRPLKLIVVMVGLPARGKSYLCKQMTQNLQNQGLDAKIYNVGNTRRAENTSNHQDASFFNSGNAENVKLREKYAIDTLKELLAWLYQDSTDKVALFDATNSTKVRRAALLNCINNFDAIHDYKDTDILLLENIVDDEQIIESNIILKLMLSPDYNSDLEDKTSYDLTQLKGGSITGLNAHQQEAYSDFLLRLKNYEQAYETIETEELALLKKDKDNNNNIKMIKLYNYGGTFVRPGDVLFYNVMTTALLLQSKKPKRLESTKDYLNTILEFLLGYRYEYASPPSGGASQLRGNKIHYHTVITK